MCSEYIGVEVVRLCVIIQKCHVSESDLWWYWRMADRAVKDVSVRMHGKWRGAISRYGHDRGVAPSNTPPPLDISPSSVEVEVGAHSLHNRHNSTQASRSGGRYVYMHRRLSQFVSRVTV